MDWPFSIVLLLFLPAVLYLLYFAICQAVQKGVFNALKEYDKYKTQQESKK